MLLAFVRFRERDTKGLQRCADNLAHALERDPDNPRSARFARVVDVVLHLLHKRVAASLAAVRELAHELKGDAFDVEGGMQLLALVAELSAADIQLDEAHGWVDTLALRFSTTRGLGELLARAAAPTPRTSSVCVRHTSASRSWPRRRCRTRWPATRVRPSRR